MYTTDGHADVTVCTLPHYMIRETPQDDWLSSKWKGLLTPRERSDIRSTGVCVDVLR